MLARRSQCTTLWMLVHWYNLFINLSQRKPTPEVRSHLIESVDLQLLQLIFFARRDTWARSKKADALIALYVLTFDKIGIEQ
jgi:hypothetical protein